MTKGQSSEILETHLQYSALVFYSILRGFFLAKQPFSSWWYGTILIMDISYLVPDASNSFNFNLVAVLGFSATFWTKVYSSFELFCVFLKKRRPCSQKIFTFACNCLNNGTFIMLLRRNQTSKGQTHPWLSCLDFQTVYRAIRHCFKTLSLFYNHFQLSPSYDSQPIRSL